MGPYSLLSVGNPGGTIQAQDPFASFLIQPYQLNSGGNLPGNTDISVNGGVMISGSTSSIILNTSNSPTSTPSINFSGPNNQILFTNPTTNIPNVVIGDLPNNFGFGMLVSQSGINVLTATAAQLIFNSNQDIFKIVSSGTATLNGPNGAGDTSTTVTFSGLNRRPTIFAYLTTTVVNIGGDSYEYNYVSGLGNYAAIADWQWFWPYLSGADGKIEFHWTQFATSDLSAYTSSWKYYLLQETST